MRSVFKFLFWGIAVILQFASCKEAEHKEHPHPVRQTITLTAVYEGIEGEVTRNAMSASHFVNDEKVNINGYDYPIVVGKDGKARIFDVPVADTYYACYPSRLATMTAPGTYVLKVPQSLSFETDSAGKQLVGGIMLGQGNSKGILTFRQALSVLDVAISNQHTMPIRMESIETESGTTPLWGRTSPVTCVDQPDSTGHAEPLAYTHDADSCGTRVRLDFDHSSPILKPGETKHFYISLTRNEDINTHYTFRIRAVEMTGQGALTNNALHFFRESAGGRKMLRNRISSVSITLNPADEFTVRYPVDDKIVLPGNGTKESPYIIRNTKDFNRISSLITVQSPTLNGFAATSQQACKGTYFRQVCDINAGGEVLQSIYSENGIEGLASPISFAGDYNGANYAICNYSEGTADLPLFPYVQDATIRNLYITHNNRAGSPLTRRSCYSTFFNIHVSGTCDGSRLFSNEDGAGGIVNSSLGDDVFERCTSDYHFNVSSVESPLRHHLGGLIGDGRKASLTDCHYSGSITVTACDKEIAVGGLIGCVKPSVSRAINVSRGDGRLSLSGCTNTASIYVVSHFEVYAGGLLGVNCNVSSLTPFQLSACTNRGSVSVCTEGPIFAGGLVGRIQKADFFSHQPTNLTCQECVNDGNLLILKARNPSPDLCMGGLIGSMFTLEDATLVNCANHGELQCEQQAVNLYTDELIGRDIESGTIIDGISSIFGNYGM